MVGLAMTRRAAVIASVVVCVVGLAACGSSAGPGSGADTTIPAVTPTLPVPTTSTVPTTTPTPTTGPSLSLAVEPANRYGSVDQMIQHAGVSLDLTLSRLTDPEVEILLVAAHHRGVSVRALLDHAGSGGAANLTAYSALQAGGVSIRWAADSVVFHQSTITADHDVSAVMTTGPDTADTTTRGYVVLDRQPAAVASIESVFASDWSGAPVRRVPTVAGLVWSPGAKLPVVGLIASAHHTLSVECGPLASMAVVSALRVASRRGVTVTLTMTANPQWATAVAQLSRAGVRIATYPASTATLAIQATAMVVDGSTAFVGSQLFTSESLVHDRELGLTTMDPAVVGPLALTLAADFARATTPAGGTTATTSASTG
jgi:phosphatidylserine/phosphatidylglycerophosphate/cardiolipin synthase-like enzyme